MKGCKYTQATSGCPENRISSAEVLPQPHRSSQSIAPTPRRDKAVMWRTIGVEHFDDATNEHWQYPGLYFELENPFVTGFGLGGHSGAIHDLLRGAGIKHRAKMASPAPSKTGITECLRNSTWCKTQQQTSLEC